MKLQTLALVIMAAFSGISFVACEKKDSFGEKKIKGKLLLEDTILKKGIVLPQADVDILLSNSNSFSEYIYKTKTDSEGNFSFTYQPVNSGTVYLLGKTTKDSIVYTVISDAANFSMDGSLIMYPLSDKGLKVVARDPQGNPLPNATICIFNGPLALGTDDCSQAIKSKLTNETGVAFFSDLPYRTEPYYLLAKSTIGTSNLRWAGSVNSNNGVTTFKDIKLTIQNGLTLTLQDDQNTPLNNAQIYVYRSRAVFLIDSTHSGSIFNLNTSISGKASLYNIDAATYYLRMLKQIGGTTLKHVDSIVVNTSGITDNTFLLR